MRKNLLIALMMLAIGFTANVARAELTAQSSIDDVLDALDARGKDLKSFTADVSSIETDQGTGNATTRTGKVWYQSPAAGNPRIRVLFDKREANNKIRKEKIEWLLAGQDLIERNYQTTSQMTRHVLKPDEKLDLFKLGEGPFPLPIGQPKQDVHDAFEVTKIDAAKDDPEGTVHLKLDPKSGTRLAVKFSSLDVWVNMKDGMPRKIDTLSKNKAATRGVELANVQINIALNDSDFTLPKIGNDWNQSEEAYNE